MIGEAGQTVGFSSKEISGWWMLGDAQARIAAVALSLSLLVFANACSEKPAESDSSVQATSTTTDPHGQSMIDAKILALESQVQESSDHRAWASLAVLYGYEGRIGEAREAADRAISLGADPGALAARIDRAHNEGEI